MNLPVTQKHFLSFSRKLFLSVISLFLVFAVCFIAYQYQREREYKVELLNTKLQDYNSRLYEQLSRQSPDSSIITGYINNHILEDLRVTLIDIDGNVLYDNYSNHNGEMDMTYGVLPRRPVSPIFIRLHVTKIILSVRLYLIMSASSTI